MTRLEHFAAAAMSGVLANVGFFGHNPDHCARHAVAYAKALAEEIDRQFTPDCDDPDQKREA